jgi:hypothetical protein
MRHAAGAKVVGVSLTASVSFHSSSAVIPGRDEVASPESIVRRS